MNDIDIKIEDMNDVPIYESLEKTEEKKSIFQKIKDFFAKKKEDLYILKSKKEIDRFLDRNALKSSLSIELERTLFLNNHKASLDQICKKCFGKSSKAKSLMKQTNDFFAKLLDETIYANDMGKTLNAVKNYESTFLKMVLMQQKTKEEKRAFKKTIKKAFE